MEDQAHLPQDQPAPRGSRLALGLVTAVAGLCAAAGLIMDRGFPVSPFEDWVAPFLQSAGVVILLMERALRAILMPAWREKFLRHCWAEILLLVAGIVLVLMPSIADWEEVLAAGAVYVALTAICGLVAWLFRWATAMAATQERIAGLVLLTLVGGFVLLAAGSGLLMLPAATTEAHHSEFYVDALFTSVAAVCTTGLSVVNIGKEFTPAGQGVILAMVQLGGLGVLMLGALAAMLLNKSFSLRPARAIAITSPGDRLAKIRRMATAILVGTAVIEAAGAVLLYPMFKDIQGEPGTICSSVKAIWDSVFHSVSAFCNAGVSLYPNNLMQGVHDGWSRPIRDYWQVLGVIAPLIILGGLGYPVLEDLLIFGGQIFRRVRTALSGEGIAPAVKSKGSKPLASRGAAKGPAARPAKQPWPELTLHTRTVLWTTAMLLVLSPLGLLFLEPHGGDRASGSFGGMFKAAAERSEDWNTLKPQDRVCQAIFQNLAARSTGFHTLECREFSNAGKLWMCLQVFIGSSPAGAGGGIRTVAFVLLLMSVWSALRQRKDVEMLDRIVPVEIVRASFAMVMVYTAALLAMTLFLCLDLPSFNFIDVLMEASSAIGTCGLSTGITRSLDPAGKAGVMAGMFLGRVLPLTLVMGMSARLRQVECVFPEEPVALA